MNLLFDITADHIGKLNDADLRTLVGLLCEADFRRDGLPLNHITCGGDQNASDGGIDVGVNCDSFSQSSFIPKAEIGFQVKKSNLGPTQIKGEMKPGGALRGSIRTLIQNKGAYIIASGQSVTASALERRIQAMRDAVKDHPGGMLFHVDYYDSSKLAIWVKEHPSVILWLRKRIGHELQGWQRYGHWSGNSDEYIPDEGVRLRNPSSTETIEMDSMAGLLKIKSVLSQPRVSLRLAGLSGVGKTRFVQALFEDNVLKHPLNQNLAVYADISDSPNPDPISIARQLIAQRCAAILIIDNCPPNLHRQLTKTCGAPESQVSVLTIEYDVRDDLPEETDVFFLEPSSDEVIQKLIQRHNPSIGNTNSRTISRIAGGNARVAVALANTVQAGESLTSFRDDDLFLRLFWQRNTGDLNLLAAAEVCSLIYSFEGENTQGENSELKFLGGLINMPAVELFRHVNTLKERNLIQIRNVWRAVLPHAIANKLAKQALNALPADHIIQYFAQHSTERLVISFSKRMAYLHDNTSAVQIAKTWLQPEGIIGRSRGDLNTLQTTLLQNIASTVPSSVLEYIELIAEGKDGAMFTSRANVNFNVIVRLLCQLAYDEEWFQRSTKLLCRFALSERPGENNNSIRGELGRLFQLYLSGTHATINQRSAVVRELLESRNNNEEALGIFLLAKLLKTGDFTGRESSFGARSRNYGYRPNNHQEVFAWYEYSIRLCTTLAIGDNNIGHDARTLLASKFRGLWRSALIDPLIDAAIQIHERHQWHEGWLAVKTIFEYDQKLYSEEVLNKLKSIEESLRPKTLITRARTFILTKHPRIFDFEEPTENESDIGARWARMQMQTKELGSQVMQQNQIFIELLPELLSNRNDQLRSFGIGLAEGSVDLAATWNTLCRGLECVPENIREYDAILGFLNSCATLNPKFYHTILDGMSGQRLFSRVFPHIQSMLGIDQHGITRLAKSLEIGIADIEAYRNVPYRIWESVAEHDWIQLHRKLLEKSNGVQIVIDSLHHKFDQLKRTDITPSSKLFKFSNSVLARYDFTAQTWESLDDQIASLIEECLKDNGVLAAQLCLNLKQSIVNYTFRFDYRCVIRSLATVQPSAFLDVFMDDLSSRDSYYSTEIQYLFDREYNPLEIISDECIVRWCERNPATRVPSILINIKPLMRTVETNELKWKPAVLKLLEMAPDPVLALKHLRVSIQPLEWDVTLTTGLKERITLLMKLRENERVEISEWAKSTMAEFQELIKTTSEAQKQKLRISNETFE